MKCEFVRTLDDLGRVGIPKTIREKIRWDEGDQIAIKIYQPLFAAEPVIILEKVEGEYDGK